ncbi:hypothetical protein AAC387_Pa05g2939 [Persea americana]
MQVSEETPSSQLTHWKIFSCSTVHRQQLRMNLMDGAACVTSGTQGSYTMGQEIFRTQLIHHSTSSSPPPSSSPSPSPAPLSGSPPTRNRVRKGEDEPPALLLPRHSQQPRRQQANGVDVRHGVHDGQRTDGRARAGVKAGGPSPRAVRISLTRHPRIADGNELCIHGWQVQREHSQCHTLDHETGAYA